MATAGTIALRRSRAISRSKRASLIKAVSSASANAAEKTFKPGKFNSWEKNPVCEATF